MWVTDSRMLCSLPMSCLVHPVDHFDSGPDDIFNCVSCFLVKKCPTFKWKDAISGFPVSPGSAEVLVRWGGKIKYILIAYFLHNICAKNCRNRTVYVKIIASCKGGTFLRHGVHFALFMTRTKCNEDYWEGSAWQSEQRRCREKNSTHKTRTEKNEYWDGLDMS